MVDATKLSTRDARRGCISRRSFAATAVCTPLLAFGASGGAHAQDLSEGDVPTTGGMRPGPGGEQPIRASGTGIAPIAMSMERFGIDGEVYASEIIDGAMQNPTGPFVIAWYPTLGSLGQNGNLVIAAHVDYYNVGPAIFWGFKEPGANVGDQIMVIGEDGSRHTYEVQRSTIYDSGALTAEIINNEVSGPTRLPTLTIITCGGEFDAISGEYLSRIVVRCTRVSVEIPS